MPGSTHWAALLAVGLSISVARCGDGGDGSRGHDGPVLFGLNCVGCHATDASDISVTTAAAIQTALETVPQMNALQGTLSKEDILGLAAFLDSGAHSGGWRGEEAHGAYAESHGVEVCQECHGSVALTGAGAAPSCFACHGKKW